MEIYWNKNGVVWGFLIFFFFFLFCYNVRSYRDERLNCNLLGASVVKDHINLARM